MVLAGPLTQERGGHNCCRGGRGTRDSSWLFITEKSFFSVFKIGRPTLTTCVGAEEITLFFFVAVFFLVRDSSHQTRNPSDMLTAR